MTVFGQSCPPNGTPSIRVGWQRGTQVKVYINPSIPAGSDARRAIEETVRIWNAASSNNNSGVVYTPISSAPSAYDNYIIVTYKDNIIEPENGNRVRAIAKNTTDLNTGYTQNALIELDPVMTSYAPVLETMSHEFGHPAGLNHCTGSGCTATSSVMTQVVTSTNPTNFNRTYGRVTSPTACDNQTLFEYHYPAPCGGGGEQLTCEQNGGFWNSDTCLCELHNHQSGGGGYIYGGGGEPFPCTEYYLVTYYSWDSGETWEQVNSTYAGCFTSPPY